MHGFFAKRIMSLCFIIPVVLVLIASKSPKPGDDTQDHTGGYPDDTGKIVFCSDRDGNKEIYIMNSDGSNVRQITRSIPDVHFPSFSSDGSKLIFNSIEAGKRVLMILNLTDGSAIRYLPGRFNVYHPAWSPDGKKIAYIAERNRNLDICVVKADGSDKKCLASHYALDEFPSWEPDGTHIAFESGRTGKKQIFIIGADGAGLKQITTANHNNSSPDWGKVPYSETKSAEDNQIE